MTGLELAHNIIRPDSSDQVDGDESKSELCSEAETDPEGECAHVAMGARHHNQLPPVSTDDDSEEIKDNITNCEDESKTGESSSSTKHPEGPAALCRCDLYCWQPGDYTLAGDESDPGLGKFCLDAMLNLCSEGIILL